jgi:uncharacterized RDD family membrane protein YckC
MEIARYEKRLAGWLTDKALSALAFGLVLWACRVGFPPDASVFSEILLSALAAYVFYVFFATLSLYFFRGATPGMALFGIRTYHPTSEKLAFRECLLKALATGLSAMCLVNAIYMLSAHTERSAFDRLTKTIVIDRRR